MPTLKRVSAIAALCDAIFTVDYQLFTADLVPYWAYALKFVIVFAMMIVVQRTTRTEESARPQRPNAPVTT